MSHVPRLTTAAACAPSGDTASSRAWPTHVESTIVDVPSRRTRANRIRAPLAPPLANTSCPVDATAICGKLFPGTVTLDARTIGGTRQSPRRCVEWHRHQRTVGSHDQEVSRLDVPRPEARHECPVRARSWIRHCDPELRIVAVVPRDDHEQDRLPAGNGWGRCEDFASRTVSIVVTRLPRAAIHGDTLDPPAPGNEYILIVRPSRGASAMRDPQRS